MALRLGIAPGGAEGALPKFAVTVAIIVESNAFCAGFAVGPAAVNNVASTFAGNSSATSVFGIVEVLLNGLHVGGEG